MGCDIHGFIEKKKKPDGWYWKLATEVDGNRNYSFFGVLNNVREELAMFPDRGFPDDASSSVEAINEYWDGDAHSHSWISRQEVEDALKSDSKVSITRFWPDENLKRIKEGDYSALYPCCGGTSMPGWTEATIDLPLDAIGVKQEFQRILDAMNLFPEYETRFVFWFDN